MQDFGDVVVGSNVAATIQVMNVGGAATGPLAIAVTGTDVSQFAPELGGCAGQPLAPQASCTVTVRFQPDSPGTKRATLLVTAPGGVVASVDLIGTSTVGPGLPDAGASPDSRVSAADASGPGLPDAGTNPDSELPAADAPGPGLIDAGANPDSALAAVDGPGPGAIDAGANPDSAVPPPDASAPADAPTAPDGPLPAVLASAQSGVDALAVRGGYVYWSTLSGRTAGVSRVPREGGTPTVLGTITEPGIGSIRDVAVDNFAAYAPSFYTAGGGYPLSKLTFGGVVSGLGTADGLAVAVDSSNVYFTDYMNGKVYKVDKAGGTPVELAAGLRPLGIAVDSLFVYWDDADGRTVNRVPIAGGTNQVLTTVSPAVYLQYLAVDEISVYFIDEGDDSTSGRVLRIPRAGGQSPVTLASGLSHPVFLAIDDDSVFFSIQSAGTIESVPKVGGPVVTRATGQAAPLHVAVDETYLYWVNQGDGTIMRMRKRPPGPCTGSSVSFNGTNTLVEFANTAGMNLESTSYTIEAWVEPRQHCSWICGLWMKKTRDENDGWYGRWDVNDSLTSTGLHTDPGVIPLDRWAHVAATYSKATGVECLWVNGVPSKCLATAATEGPNAWNITLGNELNGFAENYFGGYIDEFRISNVVRYTTGFVPETRFAADPSTLGLWHLDEGTGTTTASAVGSMPGTLTSGAWAPDVSCTGP